MKWRISPETIDAYNEWAELSIERTLMVPGVIDVQNYKKELSSADRIMVTYEFIDLHVWASWYQHDEVRSVLDELRALVTDYSAEIWNMDPHAVLSSKEKICSNCPIR
jgi:antibiotic biosynthesis monooxygenase (ABM) superfamily enzyme